MYKSSSPFAKLLCMIVVDTQIIAARFLPSQQTPLVERLSRFDPEWHAPRLWKSEFRRLITEYYRRGNLAYEDIFALQQEAENLMQITEWDATSHTVLRVMSESFCSSYDCEFIALAIQLDVPLVTMRQRLIHAYPEYAQSISHYLCSEI